MHDRCNIVIAVAAFREDVRQVLQIGDRVQVRGGLLASKAPIEVAADRRVLAVPCKLADVIDMIGNMRERHALVVLCAACPAGAQHPVIEGNPDHPVARDDGVDLLIVQLALMGNQCTAIIMAGKDHAAETIHGFPKCLIREMGEIEQNSQPSPSRAEAACPQMPIQARWMSRPHSGQVRNGQDQ